MTLKQFKNYCLKKKGVQETYPFDDSALVMKVVGKMFCLTNVKPLTINSVEEKAFHHISVKCDPEMGDDLKRNHKDIIPGWHLNKTHWISLLMEGNLKDDMIKMLIDHSYDLVVSKMTKKDREKLALMT
ncbi:MAG: MmcQ/YjbR family DNA-binding protein [Chlamydiia bacterium]|nr:MmcQ/YjbR family DNA-binding protein [Chlamydiia bacterium]